MESFNTTHSPGHSAAANYTVFPMGIINGMIMGQTQGTQAYDDEDFFLQAGPADGIAPSSTTRPSLHRPSSSVFTTHLPSEMSSIRVGGPVTGFTPSPPGLQTATSSSINPQDSDVIVVGGSNGPSWNTPNRQLSPLRRSPASLISNHNSPLLHQSSSTPRECSPIEFQSQRSIQQQSQGGYIDLTADPSPPTMPTAISRLTPSHSQQDNRASLRESMLSASKRRKTQPSPSPNAASSQIKDENEKNEKIEEIDLRDVDDDTGLSKVLEQQRAETVRSQQKDGNEPIKLSSIQCVICMESMTNITATYCGRLINVILLSSTNINLQ